MAKLNNIHALKYKEWYRQNRSAFSMHRLSVMDHRLYSHNDWSEHKAHSNSGKLCDHSSLVVCLRQYKHRRPAEQDFKTIGHG